MDEDADQRETIQVDPVVEKKSRSILIGAWQGIPFGQQRTQYQRSKGKGAFNTVSKVDGTGPTHSQNHWTHLHKKTDHNTLPDDFRAFGRRRLVLVPITRVMPHTRVVIARVLCVYWKLLLARKRLCAVQSGCVILRWTRSSKERSETLSTSRHDAYFDATPPSSRGEERSKNSLSNRGLNHQRQAA